MGIRENSVVESNDDGYDGVIYCALAQIIGDIP